MHYIPTTEAEEKDILKQSGIENFDELISVIPSHLQIREKIGIGYPLSEIDIEEELKTLSAINQSDNVCFIGGGIYDHFIPKAVDFLAGRSEFYTAYSPYQAEVSQGTLQYLYEFQSMICELSGMDIANASLYDGATAIAEACSLALSVTRKNKIIYSSLLHPHYINVLKTCLKGFQAELIALEENDGRSNLDTLSSQIEKAAIVLIQSPNTYGLVEDWGLAKAKMGDANALLVAIADPHSLSLLKSPGACGADIYVGEGQSLGNAMNYGGPLLGLMAAKDKYKRKMPGRIIGKTVDKNNIPGYVLTLQTREQHIRREKATSNICTNQGLLALRATIYMALMGKNGLSKAAQIAYQNAQYAANLINELDCYSLKYNRGFLKEFIVETSHSAQQVVEVCYKNGITVQQPEYDSTDTLIQIAVTEKRNKRQIDTLIECLSSVK